MFRPALPYSQFMGKAEHLETEIKKLIEDIRAHKANLEKLQTATVWSVLYPEVEE